MLRVVLACMALGAACTSQPPLPVLQLTPASLGGALDVQQQLTFEYGPHAQSTLQAALEVDDTTVQLAALAMGQTAVRLTWDGVTLQEKRAAWVPSVVSGPHILSDLQLVLWPGPAIRAALPPRCTLAETPGWRLLYCDGQLAVSIGYDSPPPRVGRATLRNLRYGYKLTVETAP